MEADRLRSGRLPEDVVLKDANAAIPSELRGKAPVLSESTCAATIESDFHALQSWRVRSSGSRPGTQFTSSGLIPVSYSPSKRRR